MTTQKKKPVAKTTTKKSTSSITDKELGNILTETLAKVAEPEPTVAQPQPVKIDGRDKTAFMVVMLSRPEGATLKEMAEALGWKENSIRGAMSLYAKNEKKNIFLFPCPEKRSLLASRMKQGTFRSLKWCH